MPILSFEISNIGAVLSTLLSAIPGSPKLIAERINVSKAR